MVAPMLMEDIMMDESLTTGYGPKLDEGKVTDLERFTEEFMLEQRIGNGEAGFAKQYMLDTSLQNIDKYPLKLEDLIVADLDKTQARGRYMSEREAPYILNSLPCVGLPRRQILQTFVPLRRYLQIRPCRYVYRPFR